MDMIVILIVLGAIALYLRFRDPAARPLRLRSPDSRPLHSSPERHTPRSPTAEIIMIGGDGFYDLPIIGESSYRSTLESIADRNSERRGQRPEIKAQLISEDSSPHKQAVCVQINGRTVGYLSENNARSFTKVMKGKFSNGKRPVFECHAEIRGGGIGNDFGVWLDTGRTIPNED